MGRLQEMVNMRVNIMIAWRQNRLVGLYLKQVSHFASLIYISPDLCTIEESRGQT